MASTLPDFTALGERPSPRAERNIVQFRPTTGMEEVPAQELAQSGANLEMAARVAQVMRDQHDTLRRDDALNKFRQSAMDLAYGDGGFLKLKGENAVNQPILKDYGAKLDQVAAQLSGSLDNDSQRAMFQKGAGIVGLQYRRGLINHIAQQTDVLAENTYQATIKTSTNAAAADPSQTDFALVTMDNAIDTKRERNGFDAKWAEAEKSGRRSDLYAAQIKTIEVNDPAVAWNYMHQQKVWDALDPNIRAQLEASTKRAIVPTQTKASADIAIGGVNQANVQVLMKTLDASQQERVQKVFNELSSRPAPSKKLDTNAQLGQMLNDGARLSEAIAPNDPVYKDMVTQQIRGHVATLVAVQEGQTKQIYDGLEKRIFDKRIMSTSALLSDPQARQQYDNLNATQQLALRNHIEQNIRESLGGQTRGFKAGELQAIKAIHAGTITNESQLYPLVAGGALDKSGLDAARNELLRFKDPIKGELQQRVGWALSHVERTMRTSLEGKLLDKMEPGKINDAVVGWYDGLRAKIIEYEKTPGKDPMSLLQANTTDSMMKSEVINSYMPKLNINVPGGSERTSETAPIRQIGGFAPKRVTGSTPEAVNPKTGERLIFKDGKWQKP